MMLDDVYVLIERAHYNKCINFKENIVRTFIARGDKACCGSGIWNGEMEIVVVVGSSVDPGPSS